MTNKRRRLTELDIRRRRLDSPHCEGTEFSHHVVQNASAAKDFARMHYDSVTGKEDSFLKKNEMSNSIMNTTSMSDETNNSDILFTESDDCSSSSSDSNSDESSMITDRSSHSSFVLEDSYDSTMRSNNDDTTSEVKDRKTIINNQQDKGTTTSINTRRRSRRGAISRPFVKNAVYRLHAPVADSVKKRFNILCLDGGGMRGVVECAMLEYIEDVTGKRIHELFDLVCGTSTGGILASVITFSHKSAKEARQLYLNLGEKIFGKRNFLKLLKSSDKGIYNSEQLAQVFRDEYDPNELMLHPEFPDPMKKLFLIATEMNAYNKYESVLFRNYVPKIMDRGADFPNVTIVDALRASTAAPFYLDSVQINDALFVDGGVMANNPSYHALMEAIALWGRDKEYTIVSLGTGKVKKLFDSNSSKSVGTVSPMSSEHSRTTRSDHAETTKSNSEDSRKSLRFSFSMFKSTSEGGDEDMLPRKNPQKETSSSAQKWPQGVTANLSRLLSVLTDSERISADVEKTIRVCMDPNKVKYHRLNPPDLGDIDLATADPYVINKMYYDAKLYVMKNEPLFKQVCGELIRDPFI